MTGERLIPVEFKMDSLHLGWQAWPVAPLVGDIIDFGDGYASPDKVVVKRRWHRGIVGEAMTMVDAGLYRRDSLPQVICEVTVVDSEAQP